MRREQLITKEELDSICNLVCRTLSIDPTRFYSKSRKTELVIARSIAIKIAIDKINKDKFYSCMKGWSDLGDYFKLKHCSVIHCYNIPLVSEIEKRKVESVNAALKSGTHINQSVIEGIINNNSVSVAASKILAMFEGVPEFKEI